MSDVVLSSWVHELVGGNLPLLRELVGLFREDCVGQLAAVREAIRQGDRSGLKSAAHLLRGSVGNFATSTAYEAARRLEAMAAADDMTSAEAVYNTLEEGIRQLQTVLGRLARM